jgi:hypothetical protein
MLMHEKGTSMCTLADRVAVCNYAFEVRSGQTLYLIIAGSQIKNKLMCTCQPLPTLVVNSMYLYSLANCKFMMCIFFYQQE